MLRALVLFLLLVNAAYLAWSQGYLASYGFAPIQQSDPARVAMQLNPDAVQLLSAAELQRLQAAPVAAASAASATMSAPTLICLQTGLFTDAQAASLKTALQTALPGGGWRLEPGTTPARWIVYMGKYASAELLQRKKDELASRNVRFYPLSNPELEPGLSLGGFAVQAEANAALQEAVKHGVRTAKVLQESPAQVGQQLVLTVSDEAARNKLLASLQPQLVGKALQACR